MSSARWVRSQRVETSATRGMGALFGLGAAGFVVGPLDAYASRVGARGDALTFFIGSILFTAGGLTQSWLAYPERRAHRAGLLAWRAAWVQSVGTFLFNFMTLEAIWRAASDAHYNALVWTPNALGSACFLISGALLYASAPRAGWRPVRHAAGWWEPPVNLLGCVLFGISAVAGFAITGSGQLLDLATANWTTTFGAACFLAVALAALIVGMTFKIPRLSRLVAFQRALVREVAEAGCELEADARRTALAAELSLEAAGRAIEPQVVKLARAGEQELAHVERLVERDQPTHPDPEFPADAPGRGGSDRFSLVFDGVRAVGVFKEIDGLDGESCATQARARLEGGRTELRHSDGSRCTNLVLRRGVDVGHALWRWHQRVVAGEVETARRDARIEVLDMSGQPVAAYTLARAWPRTYSALGPAACPEGLVEEIEIVHEGLTRL